MESLSIVLTVIGMGVIIWKKLDDILDELKLQNKGG